MNQFENGGTLDSQASYIDPNSTLDGTLRTDRDLRVEGAVTGTVICDGELLVAEGANVDAEVDASSIIVAGQMSGTIRCRGRLEIRSTGMVSGDVSTGALVILEGARYEGRIEMEAGAEDSSSTDTDDETPDDDSDYDSEETEYSFLRRFAPDDDEEETSDDES